MKLGFREFVLRSVCRIAQRHAGYARAREFRRHTNEESESKHEDADVLDERGHEDERRREQPAEDDGLPVAEPLHHGNGEDSFVD